MRTKRQLVLQQFFAQGIAVQAQPQGGLGLVVVGLGHHHFQQGFLDRAHQHVVHAVGLGAPRSSK
jgi:hypothetical protein